MKYFRLPPDILLLLALTVFAWAPLLTPAYFFEAHDAKHSIFFLVEFDQTFRDGYWWPRWSPDFAFGYGYPLFNLYAPLAFYAAELLHLIGLSLTAAVKTMYVAATIGAGLGMYGFARRLFGRAAGLLAAVLYVYAPFHLVEIFVRSAYAEFVALAIVPFVFWAFTELIAAPSRRRLAAAGIAYGLLALTHHATFFSVTPFLMIYLAYLLLAKFRRGGPATLLRPTLFTAGGGLLGVALAAIYLIPVAAETQYIKVEQWTSGSYSYLQHFVYFAQLVLPDWGYGYAGPGLADDFSFQLGLMALALLIFALVSIARRRYPHHGTALFLAISTVAITLLMTPVAEPVWRALPIAALVQFPWRLLGLIAFTMAATAGALLAAVEPDSDRLSPALVLLMLVAALASFAYTQPQYTDIPAWAETPLAVINWDRASIVDRVGMVSATEEQPQTSPMEIQYQRGEPLTTAAVIAGNGTVAMLRHGGASDAVQVRAATPVTLQFYTYDYPGWQVWLDDELIEHRPEPPYGLITVDLPAGDHRVELRMGSTPARTAGTVISGLAALLIVGLSFVRFDN